MKYYYINTDKKTLDCSPHAKWIRYDRAFTSGNPPEGYEKYGAQVLGKLELGDILFMYVNKRGVVAAGQVSESWDRCSYEGSDRLIYQNIECAEYRIGVDWCLPVVNNPISMDDLREIIGWTPIPTLLRIKDTDAAERLFEEIRNRG